MRAFLYCIRRPWRQNHLLTAVWMVIFAAALCWRVWAGVHYSRLMVSFPDPPDAAENAMVVFLRTSTGELWELQPDELNPSILSRYKRFPAVRSIVAAWYEAAAVRSEIPEARTGLNWESSQRLPIRRVSSGPSAEIGLRSFAVVAEYLPETTSGSLLTWNRGVMNWQGDGLLLAIAAIQAVLGTLLLHLGCGALQTSGQSPDAIAAGEQRLSPSAVLLEIFRLILLALFAQQFWVFLQRIVNISSGPSLLIGSLLVVCSWLAIYFWVRGVQGCPEPGRLIFRMVMLTLAVSILKVLWLAGNDFRAVGDYEAFQRLGTLAAEGRWAEAGTDRSYLAFIYLRRAIFCVSPVVYCFGAGLWKIELVNVVVQAVSALLVCELIRRMSGLKVAACSLPLMLFYPEFFYSAGMVSHNVWGYFWIPLAWLIYDEFRSRLAADRPVRAGVLSRLMLTMFLGMAFGLSCTAIEFLKSYGVFMLAGAVLHLTMTPILHRIFAVATAPSQPRFILRLVFLVITGVLYVTCVTRIDRRLTELSGLKMPPQRTLEYFATMTASGFEEGHSVVVWANDYAKSARGSERYGVLIRQLLYEKLANARAFLASLPRKNTLLAFGSDAMVLTQDNLEGDQRTRRVINFSTGIIQHVVCEATVCVLLLFCLARLLNLPRHPLSAGEVLPLLTTGAVMTFIYLLAEAHPYYSQNFGYPCCWSAGLIMCGMRRSLLQHRFAFSELSGTLLNVRVTAALLVIGLTISAYLWLGNWFDRSGLTFQRLAASSESEITGGPDSVTCESTVSRTTAALTLHSREAVVPAGIRSTATFDVLCDGRPLRGLRFFVSGNQQGTGRRVGAGWMSLPVRYRVEIEGKPVCSGPIADFRQARLVVLPASYWLPEGAEPTGIERLKVVLVLETTAEFRWPRFEPDPAVAVEYFN